MTPMFATEAHANGATWADIAAALGTSPEQAELRYSPRLARRRQQMGPTTTTENRPNGAQ